MTDKQKIKEEIGRIEQILDDFNKTHNNTIDNGIVTAKKNICKQIKSFIDSLPEEPKCIYNRTLDERKKFCKYCSAACDARIEEEPASEDLEKELHSWMRENCDDNGFFNQLDLARHFAEWQKKKSMQDFLEKSEKWLAIHMPFGEVSQESVYDCIQEFKNYMQDEM